MSLAQVCVKIIRSTVWLRRLTVYASEACFRLQIKSNSFYNHVREGKDVNGNYKMFKRSAMTFVEVMIAGLLMTVVFIIGWTISSSFTGVSKVRNYENAIFLANQAVEAIRAARSVELGSDNDKGHNTLLADFHAADNQYDKNPDGFLPAVEIAGVEYRRTLSIKDVPSESKHTPSGLKLIRVNVSWKSKDDETPVEFEVVTTHCDQW